MNKKNGTDRTNGNTSFIDIISNIIYNIIIMIYGFFYYRRKIDYLKQIKSLFLGEFFDVFDLSP